MGIVELFGSAFGGGILGVLGAVVQKIADFKTKKLELEMQAKKSEHEIAMRKADADILAQEWAARTKIADIEAGARVEAADAAAFAESFKMEPQRYSEGFKPSGWQAGALILLDCLRGAVRPVLTLYLCGITTVVYLQARALLDGQAMSPEQALKVTGSVIDTILFLTTTAVTWYYGSRVGQRGKAAA